MALDPSIPLQAGQGITQPQNPLDTFGKYAGIANTMASTEATKQGIALKSNDAMQQGFQQFLALPPNMQTQGVARQLVDSFVSRGIITPAMHHDAMRTIDGAPDHASLINMAQRAWMHTASPDSRAAVLYGQNQNRDDGQTIISGNASVPMGRALQANNGQTPAPGFVPTGGDTSTFPSRGQLSEPTQIGVNPDGSPKMAPRVVVTPPGMAGPAGAPAIPGNGRLNPSLIGPGGAGGQTQPARIGAGAALGPDGTYTPSLGGAASTAMGADVTRFKADQQAVPTGQRSVQTLDKALHALDIAATGRGANTLNQMRQFLQTMTPEWANSLGFKPYEVPNMGYDLAHKYMLDYARGVSVGGTDQARAMAEASNASTSISPQAARDVLKTNIGRERQNIGQVMNAPDPTGIGYGGHAANFASNTDPRAFAFDHYTPEERKALVGSMGPQELAKFKESLVIAAKHGLINIPGAGNGGQ